MSPEENNFAYIDGANLHKAIESLDWKLDYCKFRSWLRQKLNITNAYLFIGLVSKNANLYTLLQSIGYKLIFKEIAYDGLGQVKGNCDADLVLRAVRDYYENHPTIAILVSSDGDYMPLVRFWQEKKVPCIIISPAPMNKCSILLKRTGAPIICLDDVRNKLQFRPK